MLSHFELFGLSQVFARLFRKDLPAAKFHTPLSIAWCGTRSNLSFLLAFWATSAMTVGHLLVRAGDHRLHPDRHPAGRARSHRPVGDQYRRYRQSVGMLLPLPGRKLERNKRGAFFERARRL